MNRTVSGIHPSCEELALFSRGELSFFRHWQVKAHVHRCPACELEVEQFQAVVVALRDQAATETLTGLKGAGDWSRLEREMIGNIKVGIAASQCIGNAPGRRLRLWHLGALTATLSFVFVTGWLVNIPREETDRIVGAFRTGLSSAQTGTRVVLQTTPHGVSIRSKGATLTLLHPESVSATPSLAGNASVGVRYVDEETGQVTITNVYGQ
jgi:anti-sigma factor RsiW